MKKSQQFSAFISLAAVLLSLCSCVSYSSFDDLTANSQSSETAYQYHEQTTTYILNETTAAAQQTTQGYITPDTTSPLPSEQEATGNQQTQQETTENRMPQQETTQAVLPQETTTAQIIPKPDYAHLTKGEILSVYREALEKTRGFSGSVNVNHTEAFTADIKEAHPGGALTELLANNIVKLVGSEGQQTLSFNNKQAVNADGEVIPLLLPQRTAFTLTEDGIKSAEIKEENGRLYVKIVLVPETVSMGEIPKHNASAIGYLDTSDMDFKVITISRVDITYPGSVIEAEILENGYIGNVTYTINMSTYAELSGMGISGYGTLEGAQTEKWEIQW